MRLTELIRPPTMDDAGDLLRNAGYQQIGEGSAAMVWHKPGAAFVLKLFKAGDQAYLHYLDLITRVKNPHFPVVKGKPTKITSSYYGVQLEYLRPIPFEAEERIWREIDWDHPENVPGELGVALRLIHEYVFRQSGVIPDIGYGNVMLRGQTLVIVDPALFMG